MKSTRPFPFLRLYQEGRHIKLLHHIGQCAIAQVWDTVGAEPYYLLKYYARRQPHYQRAATLADLPAAFEQLRQRRVDKELFDQELLRYADALEQLTLTPACLDNFCAAHGLDPQQGYSREHLRRAITSQRVKQTGHYLSLLNQITTN